MPLNNKILIINGLNFFCVKYFQLSFFEIIPWIFNYLREFLHNWCEFSARLNKMLLIIIIFQGFCGRHSIGLLCILLSYGFTKVRIWNFCGKRRYTGNHIKRNWPRSGWNGKSWHQNYYFWRFAESLIWQCIKNRIVGFIF